MRAAAQRGARQGPGIGHPDRDAGQSDQYAGRYQAAAADRRRDRRRPRASGPILVCDNTLLGPVFQHPLAHGADVSVYSLTKYVGGHSDLIAGAALGAKATHRADQGAARQPSARSSIRIPAGCSAARSRRCRSGWSGPTPTPGWSPSSSRDHAKVEQGPPPGVPARIGPTRSGLCPAMHGRRLDLLLRHQGRGEGGVRVPQRACEIFKLAVSLGGTESLASHPAAMTHSGVPADVRDRIGVLDDDDPPVGRRRASRTI